MTKIVRNTLIVLSMVSVLFLGVTNAVADAQFNDLKEGWAQAFGTPDFENSHR